MDGLGLITVTTHGTRVRLSTTAYNCNGISIQPYRAVGASGVAPTSNTGNIYLMKGNVVKGATGAHIVAVIESDTPMFTLRAEAMLGYTVSDFYLDADNDGDGAVVSYA